MLGNEEATFGASDSACRVREARGADRTGAEGSGNGAQASGEGKEGEGQGEEADLETKALLQELIERLLSRSERSLQEVCSLRLELESLWRESPRVGFALEPGAAEARLLLAE